MGRSILHIGVQRLVIDGARQAKIPSGAAHNIIVGLEQRADNGIQNGMLNELEPALVMKLGAGRRRATK